MRTRRTLVRKDEQRSLARRARCHRVHSAAVNRPTGVPSDPILCLRLRSRWVTLARSTAGSRVGHYNYFRSYSAERGRYTQADPIGLDGGFNRFGYANSNSLKYVDPLGLVTFTITGGGSGIIGVGGEGSAGIYISFQPVFDVGFVISGGGGGGANVGLSGQLGIVPGDLSNVSGNNRNINLSCVLVSGHG